MLNRTNWWWAKSPSDCFVSLVIVRSIPFVRPLRGASPPFASIRKARDCFAFAQIASFLATSTSLASGFSVFRFLFSVFRF